MANNTVTIPLATAEFILKTLENTWDEGPADEGWQSNQLIETIDLLEEEVGKAKIRQRGYRGPIQRNPGEPI